MIVNLIKLIPNLKDNPQIIVNTTPFLVYYDGKEKTVNLPFWDEVIPKNQEYFEKCILRNYGKMEVNALNLSKYIETSSYISLKQDPQLRGVLDKAKSDKIITNDEFAHVVQVTQELINEGYRQQYKKNVINF